MNPAPCGSADHGEAADAGDVVGRAMHRPALRRDARRSGVDVVDRDIAHPARADAHRAGRLRHRHHPPDLPGPAENSV